MQIDTKKIAARFADAEMMRLHKSAANKLSEAVASLQPENFDIATSRAKELFDSAPWLANSEALIGGCLHVSYRDLFALLITAECRRHEFAEGSQEEPGNVWRGADVPFADNH